MELMNIEVGYFIRKEWDSHWRIETRHFRSYGFLFILKGAVDYEIDTRRYHAEAGSFLSFRPGCSRLGTAAAPAVEMAAVDYAFIDDRPINLPEKGSFDHTADFDALLQRFEADWNERPEGYMQKCNAHLCKILAHLTEAHGFTAYNPHVNKMKRYIAQHCSRPITVQELARLTGLNANYCGWLFHKMQGVTIRQYINEVRIKKACTLLSEVDLPISEIALLCGYGDIYHFSSVFRKYKGMPPTEYRNAWRSQKAREF